MKRVYIHENLEGMKLTELISFAGKISNIISFARYYNGKLTEEEFNRIQLEYKSLILEEDKIRRRDYHENINGCQDKLSALRGDEIRLEEYFNRQIEGDMLSYNLLKYDNFQNGNGEPYITMGDDFLYTKFTRRTPVTRGPVFEMCFFIIGETYGKLLSSMNKLYEYPYQIEGYEFEDLTFYQGEWPVLAICSHEQFAYLDLEDDEYLEFAKLDILHNVAD